MHASTAVIKAKDTHHHNLHNAHGHGHHDTTRKNSVTKKSSHSVEMTNKGGNRSTTPPKKAVSSTTSSDDSSDSTALVSKVPSKERDERNSTELPDDGWEYTKVAMPKPTQDMTEMDKQILKERRLDAQRQIAAVRKRIQKPWLIIEPESKLARKWFTLNVIFLIFTATITPYEIALMDTTLYNTLWVMNRIVDLYFISDLFFQFNLAYMKERSHTLTTDRKEIAMRYLSTFFLPDFVSIIPFDLFADFMEEGGSSFRALRSLRLLRLLKLVRVMKASVMIKRIERRAGFLHAHVMLIKFGVGILIMAHWFACAWCMTASLETGSTWLTSLRGADDDAYDEGPYASDNHFNIYCAAVYWAVVTITSVGYGDISATNPAEQRVCTLLVLSSSCLWAYIIGSACGIISNLDVAQIVYHQNMDQLNLFIQENANDFEMELRLNMREFFHHTAGLRRNEEYNENIISKMSPMLQREVASKFCHWIKQVPYLNNVTSQFVVRLVHSSEFKLYIPQERIRTNDELKVVMKGTGSYRTKVLTKGSVWGMDFVLGYDERYEHLRRLRNTSITVALTYFEVMTISSETLEEVLNSFPFEEEMILKYANRLAAQTNILRVADFVKRCGGVEEAFKRYQNEEPAQIGDISQVIKPLLEREDTMFKQSPNDGGEEEEHLELPPLQSSVRENKSGIAEPSRTWTNNRLNSMEDVTSMSRSRGSFDSAGLTDMVAGLRASPTSSFNNGTITTNDSIDTANNATAVSRMKPTLNVNTSLAASSMVNESLSELKASNKRLEALIKVLAKAQNIDLDALLPSTKEKKVMLPTQSNSPRTTSPKTPPNKSNVTSPSNSSISRSRVNASKTQTTTILESESTTVPSAPNTDATPPASTSVYSIDGAFSTDDLPPPMVTRTSSFGSTI